MGPALLPCTTRHCAQSLASQAQWSATAPSQLRSPASWGGCICYIRLSFPQIQLLQLLASCFSQAHVAPTIIQAHNQLEYILPLLKCKAADDAGALGEAHQCLHARGHWVLHCLLASFLLLLRLLRGTCGALGSSTGLLGWGSSRTLCKLAPPIPCILPQWLQWTCSSFPFFHYMSATWEVQQGRSALGRMVAYHHSPTSSMTRAQGLYLPSSYWYCMPTATERARVPNSVSSHLIWPISHILYS